MASSSNSPLSRNTSRLNTQASANTQADQVAEQSDVPCYTCRRRHVKCDRTLPACAKCAKKGVPCLGYQKPLRWAEGVAVRGKLKGKSQPVVDSNVVDIVQKTMQQQTSSVMSEAARFGLHATTSSNIDITNDEATLLELITYHNSRMCAETVTFEQTNFIQREISQLSPEHMQKLPRVLVNCILGVAAVHRASRQPGNRPVERLALEAKVKVFQCFNQLLQSSHNQQPDVIVATSTLVFAMDLFEYGMSRWLVHFLGAANVVSSFGGLENLIIHYPHLQLKILQEAYFETLWLIVSPMAINRAKINISRRALEMLCLSPTLQNVFFVPCPARLTLSIWDIGGIAAKILNSRTTISPADALNRERLLLDVLAFRPEGGPKGVKEAYCRDAPILEARPQHWTLISTAWKGAITILALRYLYFGRAELVPQHDRRRSRTPPISTPGNLRNLGQEERSSYFHAFVDYDEALVEPTEPEGMPDFLSVGLANTDPLSRSPSPMPSPAGSVTDAQVTGPTLWSNRYGIHDEAFSALSSSFSALYDELDPTCLRYIMTPLLIFALVSRKGSPERALCISYFKRFSDFMSTVYPPGGPTSSGAPSPLGGDPLQLEVEVPWDKLDAFNEKTQQERQDSGSQQEVPTMGAPKWNWWDMLDYIKMEAVWPIAVGTAHMERGTEFWPFQLVSSVVNEDCFSHWTKTSTTAASSSK